MPKATAPKTATFMTLTPFARISSIIHSNRPTEAAGGARALEVSQSRAGSGADGSLGVRWCWGRAHVLVDQWRQVCAGTAGLGIRIGPSRGG